MSKSYDSDISIQRKHPKSRKSMDSYSRGPSKSISILPTKLRPEQKVRKISSELLYATLAILTKRDLQLLLSTFKKAFPVNVAKSYDDSVTHVITCAFKSSGAHLENRTMKYLLGLVGCKWILCADCII